MIYSENTGLLDDSFDGDTVVIASNNGRNKDKNWVRNFIKAKELAATGRIHKIVAKVTADKEHLRTLYAFREAVGTGHPLLEVCVVGDRPEDVAYIRDKVHLPLACEGLCELCKPKAKRGRPKKVVEPPKEPESPKEPNPEDTGALDMASVLNEEFGE